MGIREVLSMETEAATHYECRECGRNLTAKDKRCPDCDGERVEYEL